MYVCTYEMFLRGFKLPVIDRVRDRNFVQIMFDSHVDCCLIFEKFIEIDLD